MSVSCGLFQKAQDEVSETVSRIGREYGTATFRAAAQIFKKPLFDFPRYGEALRRSTANLFRADNAMRSFTARFSVITERLKRLGFADDSGTLWQHGYKLLDVIPADVLIGTEVKKWSADLLARKSVDFLRTMADNEELFARTLVKYDRRYLDPSRINAIEIGKSLEHITPLAREALQSLAKAMQDARTLAIAGKRAQLAVSHELMVESAKVAGVRVPGFDPNKVSKALKKSMGPTVTSYIPHFVYDAFTDDALAPYMWRLTKNGSGVEGLAESVADILATIPSAEKLKNMGMTEIDWVATDLSQRMFDGAEPASRLRSTAARLLRHRGRINALRNQGDTIVRDVSQEVFVKFFKRRMDESLGTDRMLNPFSRLDEYIMPVMRKAFLEPAVARVRRSAVGLGVVDAAAEARLNNWLNSLIGGQSATGIEYLLRKTPGFAGLIRKGNSAVSAIIYNKLLLFNVSTAALNLTQPLQFGLGKHGALATAAAVRMWTDPENYGHVIAALSNSMLSESSLGAVLGGRSHNTVMEAFDFEMRGGSGKALKHLGGLIADMRMAANGKEFRTLVLKGGADRIMALGQFMSMSEMAVRKYTTIAASFKSALDQILEQFPDARIISKAMTNPQVVLKDGRVIDVLKELSDAAPKDGKYMAIFEETASSGLVDWNRVLEDSMMHNADVNFVLSSANYSELERIIRRVPLFGPAAAAFTNYTLSVVNRLGNDVSNLVYYGMKKAGYETRVVVNRSDAVKAAGRLARYAAGTLLVGGPLAFESTMWLGLKIAHALHGSIPDDIDDPRVRSVLLQFEKYGSISGAAGIDYSARVGLDIKDFASIIYGGRFVDNPLAEWISDMFGAVGAKSEMERAKSKYRVLGKFASLFDPDQEFGGNYLGRSNPLVPMMLYNLVQTAVDLSDNAKGVGLRNELGYVSELPPGVGEIVKRGLLGRTIQTREQMRRLAEDRPKLADEISTLRKQFVDAYVRKDFPSMRRINDDMYKVNPIEGIADTEVHPDLMIDRRSLERWRMRHMEPHEIRQLIGMQKGVLRHDLSRATRHLENAGFIKNGRIDTDRIMNSGDSTDMLMLRIMELAADRASK